MTKFSVKRSLSYSSSQIFDLVIDIESYPDFLPWCVSAKEYGDNKKKFRADLEIGFNLFNQSFSSEITTVYPKKIISKAVSGPFEVLKNEWLFNELDHYICNIELNIEFKFKSIVLQKLMGKVFEHSSKKMIDAFERRAKQLYGEHKLL